MLNPDSRRHLLETLHPPAGYTLDYAVGTTYSLDLLALLTAPLAFTMLHWEEDVEVATADPIALLESIRRYADRITIFCQAGQILVPKVSQLLYGYLESSIIEVTPRRANRAFHPKVWVLRFRPRAEEEPVRYRLLCLSRNLTFDHSWDTALVLEGELSDRQLGFSQNRPLGEFISALPGLANRPIAQNIADRVKEIGAEIRRVQFQPPVGFMEMSFHPLGLKRGRQWPFRRDASKLLAISPFLADKFLDELSEHARQSILVSRLESLQAANQATLAKFEKVYVLDDAANVEQRDPDTQEAGQLDTDAPMEPELAPINQGLHGLHAKLYALDYGGFTEIWTGSANATNAAFYGNVEFLVRLNGKKSACGVDLILNASGEAGLRKLLVPYIPASVSECDLVAARLEQAVAAARHALVAARIEGCVRASDVEGLYAVTLTCLKQVELPAFVQVSCWPITLRSETAAIPINGDERSDLVGRFNGLSFEALTRFFAFEVMATVNGRVLRSGFVLNLPLSGLPENRNERLLQAMLKSKDQVLRLILLLLMEGEANAPAILDALADSTQHSASRVGDEVRVPLFEAMMRSLDRNPMQLDAVATLITQLEKTEEGRKLLPEHLDTIWQAIWAARKKLRSG